MMPPEENAVKCVIARDSFTMSGMTLIKIGVASGTSITMTMTTIESPR